jgi:7-keto-8-aminopelargonate synthetase-like enzyme
LSVARVRSIVEEFPLGMRSFVVDEAYSLGVIGDKGKGLVSPLGLEEAAI